MLHFSLFGFPVTVHWMFWVIGAMLFGGLEVPSIESLQFMVLSIIAAFFSVLIHELGHAMMMQRYGAKASILLHSLGGLAFADRKITRGKSIVVSLAGPLVEIACGLLVWVFLKQDFVIHHAARFFLDQFAIISIIWGLLNLIPIYPLDGGQILVSILGARRIKLSLTLSIICALAIAALFFLKGNYFGGLLLGYIAFENIKKLRSQHACSLVQS